MTIPLTADHVPVGGILVAIDGPDTSALDWAAGQAAREGRWLVLLHCTSGRTPTGHTEVGPALDSFALRRSADSAAETLLGDAALRTAALHPGLDVIQVLAEGDPRDVILTAAARSHLVVVGSRGRGPVEGVLLGSVSAAVAVHSTCPVVVVRPTRDTTRLPRVLVGARFAVESVPVIEHAFAQASLSTLPLTVTHCYYDTEDDLGAPRRPPGLRPDHDDLREQLAESVAGLGEKYPDVEVDLDLRTGSFNEVLARAASTYELVIIGRRAGSLIDRMVGTWSTLTVVENAAGTVMVVPESSS